jgi:electron transfer flavoprotein beta subunit
MKIVVCVKHVPTGRWRLDPSGWTLDRSGPGELNRFDRYAVEEAIRLKEQSVDSEVVAVSMGPAAAAESLRTVLALGADRAVLVCDEGAAGSDLLGTARVLAAVLARQDPDLTIFGQQSEDGVGGVLVAAVADLVERPFVSQAARLAVGDVLRVTRQTEAGDEVIEAPLPALVSVSDAINEPRYTSLKGVMAAKRKPLETVGLAELGLAELSPADGMAGGMAGRGGAGTRVERVGVPPPRPKAARVDDESSAAEAIVAFLTDRQLV